MEYVIENDDEANEFIYQIGNMTLLKGSLNSQIKNSLWNIKLNGDGSKKNCIKKCADLSITRDDLLDKKEWTKDDIKERTARLTKEFLKIWDINYIIND
ncbi:HNH endonuclease family protein [Helicobacter monodelphidis]|uniref:HNH endonuclease family protein n=1 Tax=Helicobacter sp. 15-1451 TaxID=2004995 RepID=UPI0015EB4191|nr:HNH endonuclease family protein [Helicobacter sp. 15-1451]